MKLTDKKLGIITLARALAIEAVAVGSMESLNGIVKAVNEAEINVLLIFISEEHFKQIIENEE